MEDGQGGRRGAGSFKIQIFSFLQKIEDENEDEEEESSQRGRRARSDAPYQVQGFNARIIRGNPFPLRRGEGVGVGLKLRPGAGIRGEN